MDSFFGIGLPELVLILLLAGLVMGPSRVRQTARTLGRTTARLQRISREFARQLNAELDALDDGELRAAAGEIKATQRELRQAGREIIQAPKAAVEEAERAFQESKSVQSNAGGSQAAASTPRNSQKTPLPEPAEVPEDPE